MYAIAFIIVGVILVNRGQKLIDESRLCGEEERAALEALGQKRKMHGMIVIVAVPLVMIIGIGVILGSI
jgi:hypothetical protein